MTQTLQPKSDSKLMNIASHLTQMAKLQPYKRAVVSPAGRDEDGRVTYSQLTFRQLDMESDCLAHGLDAIGITRGTRTILMVPPSLNFFTLTFALFKTGAIPVVVDPGMGIQRMLSCLKGSRPEAFIGISKAHAFRMLHPASFRTVRTCITVGSRWFWGGHSLKNLRLTPWQPFPPAATQKDETAAILFTTGSTGPAKGAVYSHGNFDAQIRHIQSHFQISGDEIDLPTFPLFALFDPALGMTAIIPDMDPTQPAKVDPEQIIEAIINQGVTNMFASPALLDRVGSFGKNSEIKLPSLKRVVSAGAPVSPANIEQFSHLLCDAAEIHTPYGSTEAVPILSIASQEILCETRKLTEKGYGICVGRPIDDLVVRIIKITDTPIARWSEEIVVPPAEIGEIVVKGDLVTRSYFENREADSLAKIQDGKEVWHRMGDLGWADTKGRIWFCGRKSHRVQTPSGTLYTIPCEAIFNNHPAVLRSALVGLGKPPNQKPVIIIQTRQAGSALHGKDLRRELLNLAAKNLLTKEIDTILFHTEFPVDIRHNAKIYREQLTDWAEKQIR
jgi:olefin beta-lactone synthetase